ncbi:MAG: tRNA epoxyqueuosine(34) reductase QueG [Vibrio sp.]
MKTNPDFVKLSQQIKAWGQEIGFQKVGITGIDLKDHEVALQRWLDANYHGSMEWMARHGMMRARPAELLPGTIRVISVRLDYLPPEAKFAKNLSDSEQAYISRYALGRDYHKLMRQMLGKLAKKIELEVGEYGYRPFVDSAPVLERPLAANAGLGWVGKHSLLLDKESGSWFFLGEILVDLPLVEDKPLENHCGKCTACITSCPTQAIVAEGVVDARRCISYLTIEYDGIIPKEFRSLIGNRIYGCDDCQLVCPWNREAELTKQADFHRRKDFESPELVALFAWTEDEFLNKMQGSAIRRIGHQQWLRNLSIAMGNAIYSPNILTALQSRLGESDFLDEHLTWAIVQQQQKQQQQASQAVRNTKADRLIRIIEKGLPRDA